ncbi:hypothetical protein [Sphingomonas sp. DBB INV C78]|uniref:hypothetical protein n=1 Tax=Sphingomonas sp. DBB INV C78 TaxID=3349434 RepID=UPI0036D40846
MDLFRRLLARKPAEPAQSSAPSRTAPFVVDRDRMFDLSLTSRLVDLVDTPHEARDHAWVDAYFATVWNASIQLPAPGPFIGPDGFRYMRLDIPAPGSVFDSNSLANLTDPCIEKAMGVALFRHPDADQPSYVMSMGVLQSLIQFGDWRGDPQDIAEQGDGSGRVTLGRGEEILTAAPSADFLSPRAARGLIRHLADRWDMADPRIMLMMSGKMRPTRSLVVNRTLASFADEGEAQYFCECLLWHLPPSRSITLQPDDWDADGFFRLADFA